MPISNLTKVRVKNSNNNLAPSNRGKKSLGSPWMLYRRERCMLVLREIPDAGFWKEAAKDLPKRKEGRRIQDPRPDLELITRLKNIL